MLAFHNQKLLNWKNWASLRTCNWNAVARPGKSASPSTTERDTYSIMFNTKCLVLQQVTRSKRVLMPHICHALARTELVFRNIELYKCRYEPILCICIVSGFVYQKQKLKRNWNYKIKTSIILLTKTKTQTTTAIKTKVNSNENRYPIKLLCNLSA